MEDKMEEGAIVEEPGGGGVASQKTSQPASRNHNFPNAVHDREEDESEKGDNEDPYVGWDEAYEQEV